ncbi:Uncharacterised protein [Escherichia coli]|nr:Uncharacterised protein [Escherichia coli]
MSHGIQDPIQPFSYRFRGVFHHSNVTVGRQSQQSLPLITSFLTSWPVPDILCQLFQRPAQACQLHLCTQPYQLFLPGFGHPFIVVLPQEAGPLCLTPTFNREVWMFILTDFINHFTKLLCYMEVKWSTKTGHRVRVFSSIDFPIRLVVTHHYIRAVLVRCNIQRYSPLLRELHR